MLKAHGLRYVRNGQEILAHVEVTIEPGESLAVTGPSGSGKTTLLSLLSGLAAPTAGEVYIDGQPLTKFAGPALGVAVVLQGYGLVSLLTAAENIEIALGAAGRPAAQATATARSVLARLGLEAHADQLIEELSGGQQQRTAVARALALEPRLLIADEPTAELDPAARAVALGAMFDIAAGGGSLILATHDPEVAARCDRVLDLKAGRMQAQQGPRPSRSRPGFPQPDQPAAEPPDLLPPGSDPHQPEPGPYPRQVLSPDPGQALVPEPALGHAFEPEPEPGPALVPEPGPAFQPGPGRAFRPEPGPAFQPDPGPGPVAPPDHGPPQTLGPDPEPGQANQPSPAGPPATAPSGLGYGAAGPPATAPSGLGYGAAGQPGQLDAPGSAEAKRSSGWRKPAHALPEPVPATQEIAALAGPESQNAPPGRLSPSAIPPGLQPHPAPAPPVRAAHERRPSPVLPPLPQRGAMLRDYLEGVRRRGRHAALPTGARGQPASPAARADLLPADGARPDDQELLRMAREDLVGFADLGLRLLELHQRMDLAPATGDPAEIVPRCLSCMWRWPCPTFLTLAEILDRRPGLDQHRSGP
jgi:putative ABC transport system ATP-binding protein